MPSLVGVRAKLARTDKHLKLAERLIGWYTRNKCGIDHQINQETNYEKAVVRLAPLPPVIGLILGDAVHNMRSALDYLVVQLVLANACIPIDRNMFPITDTREGFSSQVHKRRRLYGVAKAAVTVIDGLQPYHRRNLTPDHTHHFLWVLDKLENIDKHRRMALTAGMVVASDVSFKFPGIAMQPTLTVTGKRLLAYDGAILFGYKSPPSEIGEVQVKGTIYPSVVFDEPELGLVGRDAVGILSNILRLIREQILPKFERLI